MKSHNIISCGHTDGSYCCDNCKYESMRGSDLFSPESMTDEQKKAYLQNMMVSDAKKGYKSKWHPRLIWQRIKGWFK